MSDTLDVSDINDRAVAHREYVLYRIRQRGPYGRPTAELQQLNRSAPRLPDLLIRVSETGRWSAITDIGCTEGRGFVELVSTLADIDVTRAAAWVASICEAAEAA
jgi:hypothetical protein